MRFLENMAKNYLEKRDKKVIDQRYFDLVFSDYQVSSARNHIKYAVQSLPEWIKPIYEVVKGRTMTPVERLYNFCDSVDYCIRSGIDGAVVECGVWRGGGMAAVARHLVQRGHPPRDLYLYDTFEGHPMPDAERDVDIHGNPALPIWERHRTGDSMDKSDWCVADLDDVKAGMTETGYPQDRLHYVKGRVEHTLPDVAPEKIAVLRIDTDWYESIKHILNVLYDRVSPGGVIIFDDYGHLTGAQQAVDEFYEERREAPILFRIDYSCRATIKR